MWADKDMEDMEQSWQVSINKPGTYKNHKKQYEYCIQCVVDCFSQRIFWLVITTVVWDCDSNMTESTGSPCWNEITCFPLNHNVTGSNAAVSGHHHADVLSVWCQDICGCLRVWFKMKAVRWGLCSVLGNTVCHYLVICVQPAERHQMSCTGGDHGRDPS